MQRKYLTDLEKWLTSRKRKPLIVWGARQVGKSYLIKNLFAEKHFKDNYIYVDCRIEHNFVEYCESHTNPTEVLNYLSLDKGRIINESTLLIFDEAQECLPIITLLKYFNQEYPQIPIIVTGSMVRIKIQRDCNKRGIGKSEFLFPIGKINQLTVYPMNFEEFLMNRNLVLYKTITDAYLNKIPLDDAIHKKAMDCFHEFILIGGMPEAVDAFLETGSYLESRNVLKDLYDNYLNDMSLYQASQESVIRSKLIFESIFAQLNKESKNFSPSLIVKGAKTRDLLSPIDWLTTAFLIQKSTQLKETISLPLIESSESLYRLYLADIGIFSYQSHINPTAFLSSEGTNTLSGIFFENYVANELVNAGINLRYWKGKDNSEFEFVVEKDGSVIPIDVKKSKGTLNSLKKFGNHNSYEYAIKISSNKYGFDENNKILTIPFYDVFLLCKDLTRI